MRSAFDARTTFDIYSRSISLPSNFKIIQQIHLLSSEVGNDFRLK